MKVRDEVCGMRLARADAVASFEFEGKTYWFCPERCRRKFDEHPDWYVPVSPGSQGGDGGADASDAEAE